MYLVWSIMPVSFCVRDAHPCIPLEYNHHSHRCRILQYSTENDPIPSQGWFVPRWTPERRVYNSRDKINCLQARDRKLAANESNWGWFETSASSSIIWQAVRIDLPWESLMGHFDSIVGRGELGEEGWEVEKQKEDFWFLTVFLSIFDISGCLTVLWNTPNPLVEKKKNNQSLVPKLP